MKEIKDFMYLDMEKVSSLYSQLSGGIVQSVEASSTSSENSKNLRNYDFKIFKHEAGGTESESQVLKEVRVSHHDIYNELENELFKNGYAVEIGVDVSKEAIESGEATKIFESALCIKVEGHVVLEDYERITRIAHNYEDITAFVNNSIKSNLTDTEELKVIIDGLKTWVRVFLPDVFNIRVYPFEDLKKFHVMSNVKRKFFLDDNTESVHYLFGSKPTIKVTMLGVITSIPKKEGDSFDPMKEFDDVELDEEGNEAQSFENGFRGVFRGFDGLEEMIRTCRYPRIMVQPIAVYRAIKPNKALKRN
ncbi:hypothetical protein ABHN84_04185 [Shewanella vesiculosa]|uniref:Uncharacterized protein n=1 Tax=Shewanella vesiculosa TaxID=518738 RepID=A0ABV0FKY2_9GAMM